MKETNINQLLAYASAIGIAAILMSSYASKVLKIPGFEGSFFIKKKELSSQQQVVLAPSNNQIFLMHLHCLIAIFTPSYYYIYNDFFSVIYWTE